MAGLNLMELLIVMLIIAILAGIGVPSFKYVTSSNRIAGEINALLGDMRYARTEAIKEGSWVTVCAATITIAANPANSTASCSGANSWSTGWIVFSDTSDNQTAPTTFSTLLRVEAKFVGGDTLTALDSTPTGVVAVTFNREGFATSYLTLGSGTSSGTAAIQPTLMQLDAKTINVDWRRCLAINNIGMVITETPASASVVGFTQCPKS
jgi:type IV fimbrial biogenesis protein FimT